MASSGSQTSKKVQFDAGYDSIVIAENNRLAFNKYALHDHTSLWNPSRPHLDHNLFALASKLTFFEVAFLFQSSWASAPASLALRTFGE